MMVVPPIEATAMGRNNLWLNKLGVLTAQYEQLGTKRLNRPTRECHSVSAAHDSTLGELHELNTY